jgi:lipopolysaccharide/colanic/teichoic acid biosynthesis glycosyltransferase
MLHLNCRRYGSGMRNLRGYQLFWRAHADATLDQMKRLADLVVAGVLLVMTSPLMLLVALAIRWEGPGPIFERQACIGRGGRRFQMLKFRTMVPDPERTMPVWARKTTRIGAFLQYSRIEALPQLINVLRGEMSLIDPDGSSPSFLE